MVVILVFLTFCFAILIGGVIRYMASRQEVGASRFASGVARAEIPSFWVERPDLALSPGGLPSVRAMPLEFPREVYYHKGHAWVKLEGDKREKEARVGLDDFTQQVMGEVEAIELPPVGTELSQGEVAWRIHRGGRVLAQLAPLSGKVVEVNERLFRDPTLVNRSPYEKGWVLKIRPKALGQEITKLMDSFQFQVVFDQVKAKLRASIHPQALGAVYSDGEDLVRGMAEKLDEESWKTLVREVFHTSTR